MNASQLIAITAEAAGVSRREAEHVVRTFCRVVAETLPETGEAKLPDLGKFVVVEQAARAVRNPRTGEPVAIPARRIVKFRGGMSLKEAVS